MSNDKPDMQMDIKPAEDPGGTIGLLELRACTHPVDTERALKNDYSVDPQPRNLQLEAKVPSQGAALD